MRRILAATIVCAFALVTIVNADEAQKRALAKELLDAMDMQKTIEKSFEMVKQLIPAQLKQLIDSENASFGYYKAQIDPILKELSWEKLKDDYIAIYAETFTEEELKGLIRFYKTAIGQKLIEKQPELTQRIMQISQKKMASMLLPTVNQTRENERRVQCAGNLKHIALGLIIYANDDLQDGKFPDSLNILNSKRYLLNGKVYGCPNVENSATTAANSDYTYVGSGLKNTNDNPSKTILAYCQHHDNWMNVLFVDGHVSGRQGRNNPAGPGTN